MPSIIAVISDFTIDRVDGLPFGRAYKVSSPRDLPVHLPSVTTILKMHPNKEYDEIRESLGEEKYLEVLHRAADRGTVMHKWLELFLEHYGVNRDPEAAFSHTQQAISVEHFRLQTEPKRAIKIGRNLFFNFYHNRFWIDVMPIKRVMYNEIFMWTLFRGGWAGAGDFVYEDLNGDVVFADFKSSTQPKDPDKIDHYKMQISSYMFLFGEQYGTIQKIVVPYKSDSEPDMKFYLRQFLELKEKFHMTQEWIEFAESQKQLSGIAG